MKKEMRKMGGEIDESSDEEEEDEDEDMED